MDEIENLYRDYWQCMISKDIPGLDSMMHVGNSNVYVQKWKRHMGEGADRII